ncbi:MAG TPA: class A beta-lactamase-related serine hydrolase [Candidatus Handelsmanbacteria bacterium]|nr:class A beta-lactamase-related serine hydrolase [Candidatus Handelsmanbacteria bacterium]
MSTRVSSPASATLIARNGAITHREQVGFADPVGGTPITTATLYRVYSMTKPITATVLMTLHEEGRIWLGRCRQYQFLGRSGRGDHRCLYDAEDDASGNAAARFPITGVPGAGRLSRSRQTKCKAAWAYPSMHKDVMPC